MKMYSYSSRIKDALLCDGIQLYKVQIVVSFFIRKIFEHLYIADE